MFTKIKSAIAGMNERRNERRANRRAIDDAIAAIDSAGVNESDRKSDGAIIDRNGKINVKQLIVCAVVGYAKGVALYLALYIASFVVLVLVSTIVAAIASLFGRK